MSRVTEPPMPDNLWTVRSFVIVFIANIDICYELYKSNAQKDPNHQSCYFQSLGQSNKLGCGPSNIRPPSLLPTTIILETLSE